MQTNLDKWTDILIDLPDNIYQEISLAYYRHVARRHKAVMSKMK